MSFQYFHDNCGVLPFSSVIPLSVGRHVRTISGRPAVWQARHYVADNGVDAVAAARLPGTNRPSRPPTEPHCPREQSRTTGVLSTRRRKTAPPDSFRGPFLEANPSRVAFDVAAGRGGGSLRMGRTRSRGRISGCGVWLTLAGAGGLVALESG
jgi:hypothetical protein